MNIFELTANDLIVQHGLELALEKAKDGRFDERVITHIKRVIEQGKATIKSDTVVAITNFCAAEVARQQRGPIQVAWMVDAHLRLMFRTPEWLIDVKDAERVLIVVLDLGRRVENDINSNGWRCTPVTFKQGGNAAPAGEIQDRMLRWAENFYSMTPEEAYKEFEEIHPFKDGNGRVGALLYNWKRGTLDKPVVPPNFWP
jgi:hypothetical protein